MITVPVSSLNIQKSVYKAMEEADFRVIRQLSTAVACAVSKAYMMTPNQYFMVHTAADGEHQYVTALYEDDVLEILENNIGLHGGERMDINRSLLTFHAGDKTFCRQYRDYEELSAIAADGAAIQGARIKGFIRNFLLLDSFPWKAGIEIVDERKNVCFPLTWMTEERSSLPKKVRLSVSGWIPECGEKL